MEKRAEKEFLGSLMTAAELAEKVGYGSRQILNLADEMIEAGHGRRMGKSPVFLPSAADWIKSRPETRGRITSGPDPEEVKDIVDAEMPVSDKVKKLWAKKVPLSDICIHVFGYHNGNRMDEVRGILGV